MFLMSLLARRGKWQILIYDGPVLGPHLGLQITSLSRSQVFFFNFCSSQVGGMLPLIDYYLLDLVPFAQFGKKEEVLSNCV